MTKGARQYTREFKMETVRLLETSGKSANRLERELEIASSLTLLAMTGFVSFHREWTAGHG